jgi:serine protease DegQ
MDQLIRNGAVRRGQIGVAIQDLTPDLDRALGTTRIEGALIARVEPGSSAQRAGLRSSDLVVAVNGVPIHNAADLRNRVGLALIGNDIELTVDRAGSERNVTVRIERATAERERIGRAGR